MLQIFLWYRCSQLQHTRSGSSSISFSSSVINWACSIILCEKAESLYILRIFRLVVHNTCAWYKCASSVHFVQICRVHWPNWHTYTVCMRGMELKRGQPTWQPQYPGCNNSWVYLCIHWIKAESPSITNSSCCCETVMILNVICIINTFVREFRWLGVRHE